ncbi:hypothetical protein COT42_02740 [Candidatus Saganbacteria bacterium CG08_land_8_20_14_0_20_45_16]|uniref:SLH domain-containing protein n=1 Tax=Candidatus Saganbacteria bacterium CG08_land_8_20_14_0_20_45_16 TaxID=2014293 RepID=A0A2H0Y055_UNCSA|nr:MAG: hypothetical protein COT42_02740 [Candidatus Saganbacteria bacterium CG08_land_8_20_14_0_20_45_16]
MKNKQKRHQVGLVCLGLWLLSLGVSAAQAAAGVSLDPSTNLYSARQMGLAGAAIGFADDANGIFANPAGLTKITFPQLSGSARNIILGEAQYTLLAWAMPTTWGTVGLGYAALDTTGSYPTKPDPANSRIIIDTSREAMSYNNNVLALSYSRDINKNLAIGSNLKLFSQSLTGDIASSARATGLDLGFIFRPLPWLSTGGNFQNLVEGTAAWENGASDKIGGLYKLGCKVNVLGPTAEAWRPYQQKLSVGFDLDLPHNSLAANNYHLGIEYLPLQNIVLRTGYSQDGFTVGLGLISGGFRFDYAFAQKATIPGDTPHYFTLSYIGERVKKVYYQLKDKEPDVNFLSPEDRAITQDPLITLKARAIANRVTEKKTVWTVTALAATKEVQEIKVPENLTAVYLNGEKIDRVGSIEIDSNLTLGRNVFSLVGYASSETQGRQIIAETKVGSDEIKVLRFEPFDDLSMSHWALRPIALSVTLGLVKGYPDKTFRPEKGITRAELVTLLVRTMPVDFDSLLEFADFTDVPSKHWASKYIAYGTEENLVAGYPDGKFKPEKVLTRAEGVTVLARYATLSTEAKAAPTFSDLKPDFWANKYISAAAQAGLLQYLAGKDFEPNTKFTRAEACEILYLTPEIQKQVNSYWETRQPKPAPATTITPTSEAAPSLTNEAISLPTTIESPSQISSQETEVTSSKGQ